MGIMERRRLIFLEDVGSHSPFVYIKYVQEFYKPKIENNRLFLKSRSGIQFFNLENSHPFVFGIYEPCVSFPAKEIRFPSCFNIVYDLITTARAGLDGLCANGDCARCWRSCW